MLWPSVDDWNHSIFIMDGRFLYWIRNGKGNNEAGIICFEARIPRKKIQNMIMERFHQKLMEVMLDIGLYVFTDRNNFEDSY